jgi:mono/diheme cytochrome c family protein
MITLFILANLSVDRISANLGLTPTAAKAADEGPAPDPYQRSYKIYKYMKAAPSGPARGEEIFYYKCVPCHNEYVKGPPQFVLGPPQLKGLFSHPTLMSGAPVNDDNVKAKIQNGGPGMPSFRYTMNEADLSDLTSFLHECCFNLDSPPLNPQYRAK